MKVVATARNERQPDTFGSPSAWDKLEWSKYPQFWNRFTVYELPEPEDEAISQLLKVTIPNTGIDAQEENYLPIARQNDCTFRNVVENLVRLRNRKLPLTTNNYRDTLKDNWSKRYQDAVSRYSLAVPIYDAVDLLQQLGISLTRELVESTALLIMESSFWQLWHRYAVHKALEYLIDAESILSPRDGQIEARERTIETTKYRERLSKYIPTTVLGPLSPGESEIWEVILRGQREYNIFVQAHEPDVDFDLYVFDESGNLIDVDNDIDNCAYCSIIPYLTGAFQIDVQCVRGFSTYEMAIEETSIDKPKRKYREISQRITSLIRTVGRMILNK